MGNDAIVQRAPIDRNLDGSLSVGNNHRVAIGTFSNGFEILRSQYITGIY